MKISDDDKFLYELFSNGTDIPGYYRLKRCLADFDSVKSEVSSVLDAGCGGATKSIYLAKNHSCLKITGVDINEASIKNAELLKKRYHLQNVQFLHGDLIHLNNLGSFDFVIISDVLEHIENDAQCTANIQMMLKPGGYIHVNVPAKEHDYDFSKLNLAEQEDLRQWLKDAGHVRLGYTFNEIKALFPGYEVIEMRKTGNCLYKTAFFFWEKAVFDPSREQPRRIKREYKMPCVEYLDLFIEKFLAKETHSVAPGKPRVNERMFLQAMRTIDVGREMENKGLLDDRYLIEEEVCCLLKKPS